MAKLNYVIKFVENMDRGVEFYRDTLGLPLKFESPDWSEFFTGETTLALHSASAENPPGTVRVGFAVTDMETFYNEMTSKGIKFTSPPRQEFGVMLAEFVDSEGSACSVSGPVKGEGSNDQ